MMQRNAAMDLLKVVPAGINIFDIFANCKQS